MRAFHSVRTLSSRPGRGRVSRTSNSRRRASSTAGGPQRGRRATGRCRMVRPSKLPSAVTPYHSMAAAVRSSSAERGGDLGRRPGREPALLVVAVGAGRVGVLGRREAAFGLAQVAPDVGDGLVHHLEVARLAGHLPGVQVHGQQQRLVVEHLLEVGHEPLAVDGVAGEPAAEVVVDAARRHGVEAGGHHGEGVGAGARCDGPAAAARGSSTAGTWARRRTRPTRRRTAASACASAWFEVLHARHGVGRVELRRAVEGLGQLARLVEQLWPPRRATRRRPRRAVAGTRASGSRCRRRTAGRRARGTPSWASRRDR